MKKKNKEFFQLIFPSEFLPSLNFILDKAKTHWAKYYDMQQSLINVIVAFIRGKNLKPITSYPVSISFKWIMTNQRKDPDNIASTKKYILDALVKAGILENDGWKQISGFTDEFEIDKEHPRVEVVCNQAKGLEG